jgi:hypothetical protein
VNKKNKGREEGKKEGEAGRDNIKGKKEKQRSVAEHKRTAYDL